MDCRQRSQGSDGLPAAIARERWTAGTDREGGGRPTWSVPRAVPHRKESGPCFLTGVGGRRVQTCYRPGRRANFQRGLSVAPSFRLCNRGSKSRPSPPKWTEPETFPDQITRRRKTFGSWHDWYVFILRCFNSYSLQRIVTFVCKNTHQQRCCLSKDRKDAHSHKWLGGKPYHVVSIAYSRH